MNTNIKELEERLKFYNGFKESKRQQKSVYYNILCDTINHIKQEIRNEKLKQLKMTKNDF